MAQEEQVTTPKGLWLLVVLAPVIVAIEMQTNFVLVRQACSVQRNVILYAIVVIAMLLTIGTALVAFSFWRRAGADWPREGGDLGTRIRFLCMLGLLNSGISFLIIVAHGIATTIFDPCQL
jgi:hypothetical protein